MASTANTYESANIDAEVEHEEISRNGRLRVHNDSLSGFQGSDGGSADRRLITEQRSQARLDEACRESQHHVGDNEWTYPKTW
jgi:hypothetical protein